MILGLAARVRARTGLPVAGITAAAALAALAACSVPQAGHQRAAAAAKPTLAEVSGPSPAPAVSPSRRHPRCPPVGKGFACTMRRHIAAVERYLSTRPGLIGIVLRDRTTGAVWRNRYAGTQVYMASTSKLAMAITLLMRDAAGAITLSDNDRARIHDMLHVSSDSAADGLWFKYGASFYTRLFPEIGLTTAHYLPITGVDGPYWGEMTCTAEDLDRVVSYMLEDLPATMRDYMVDEMRHVGTVQHFGVWGAGKRNHPGNKDGWSTEKPGWIIDSAGFAGRGARYTLTMMNSLNGQGGYHDGTDTVTQVAALLFQGHQVAAPTLRATP